MVKGTKTESHRPRKGVMATNNGACSASFPPDQNHSALASLAGLLLSSGVSRSKFKVMLRF